jgi:ankyrin repeat protein
VQGFERLVEMLIEQGADVNAHGGDCGNALLAASWAGHEPLVEVLIKRGVNINAREG